MGVKRGRWHWGRNVGLGRLRIGCWGGGSTSCVPRSRNFISCVPRCPLHVYQLRPEVSTSRVSVASQGVHFTCYQLHPELSTELRPAVRKELHQLHRKILVYKMPNSWKVLTQFYCTLLYTQLHANTENCCMIPTAHSCYIVLLSSV
jgi:hypothetical protein